MFFGEFDEKLSISSDYITQKNQQLYIISRDKIDIEPIFKHYQISSRDFSKNIDGSFIAIVLDRENIYVYRDYFGKIPLFYAKIGKKLYFSDDIDKIKTHLPKLSLSNDGLLSYLSFLTPAPPYTLYENIYKLGGGEYLHFNGKEIKTDIYENMQESLILDTDVISNIENLLLKNIKNRPTLLLSGGLDSAMIGALYKSLGVKLDAITIGFDGFNNYSELENAKISANDLKLNLREIIVDKKLFHDNLESFLESFNEPLNDPAAFMLDFMIQNLDNDSFISGEGSDELFIGYRQYLELLDIEKLSSLKNKNWLKKYFHSNFSMNREWEWYKRIFDNTLLFRTSGEKFSDLQQNRLLRQNIKDNHSLKYLDRYNKPDEPSSWYSYIDLKLFMGEVALSKLYKISKKYNKNSLTPFLDKELARYMINLPYETKLPFDTTKPLLKELAKNYLDISIINRKKKGLSYPYMEWLLESDKIDIIKKANQQTSLFNDEVIDKYIDMAKRGRFKHQLWGLFILSHFIKREFL